MKRIAFVPLIEVATVDCFQGSEKDIIILCCVLSHSPKSTSNVGFLNDYRRLNVAFTRSRYALWIVGNFSVLCHDTIWNKMICDVDDRHLVLNGKEFGKGFNGTSKRKYGRGWNKSSKNNFKKYK